MVYGRDSQRQKVYDFENHYVYPLIKESTVPLSMAECASLAGQLCALYNLSPPAIRDGRARRSACWREPGIWDEAAGSISLPVRSRTKRIVLHESAHRIAYHFDEDEGGHGPTFVRVLIDLLDHAYPALSMRDMRRELAERNIKVSPAGVCPMYKTSDLRKLSVLRERKANLETQLKMVQEQIASIRKRNRPTQKPPPGIPKSKAAASRY